MKRPFELHGRFLFSVQLLKLDIRLTFVHHRVTPGLFLPPAAKVDYSDHRDTA